MQFDNDRNPYAPPVDQSANNINNNNTDEMQLSADRGSRFLARLIDGLLSLLCAAPVLVLLQTQEIIRTPDLQNRLMMIAVLWGGALPINIYQWSLVSRTGQSLGKKWLRLKVVKVNGSPVDFMAGVLLREWLMTVVGSIPMIGPFVNLFDALMIFGGERRCLHDRFAGTKVVQILQS